MPQEIFDPVRVVAGLRASRVRYVIVGDLAAMAHGSEVTPDRLEICVPDLDEEVLRLGEVLMGLDAEQGEPTEDPHRVAFRTSAGRVECVEIPSLESFAELEARATDVDLGMGVSARVAPPADVAVQALDSEDLVGAVRAAALDVRTDDDGVPGFMLEDGDEFGPDPDAERGGIGRRVWKAFEDVDRFLTDVTEGTRSASRGRSSHPHP